MKAASGCMRCLRRSLASRSSTHDTAGSIRAARSIFSTSTLRSDLPPSASTTELEQQRQAAKQRAWYLDPSDSAPPPSLAPSSKPRFTTFDPSSTLPTAAPALPARPLPDNAPSHFAPLHHFLTTLELLEPSSVVFLHTPSSGSLQRDEEELGVGGIGARWEWVVVAVVRGRGKGVVGRAERAVRLWSKVVDEGGAKEDA
ncbi:uncharacterized protein MKK02DRAFT_38067 [Dioszegia hungarica]|uniref:Uncharacterized protein n=1 Tax=Dioszegia hungarica TaxID=4972 RepID=A0AA38H611_9TREE|nr:uncharacterized protein MKK02DRAFT_38067 [Dioszegia hungarica]KAI9634538.1 hypothetical protein MKK02DRAFT_38067 [Dioszegia hungarica]